jgi:hypothetical protein
MRCGELLRSSHMIDASHRVGRIAIVVAHAVVGWAWCGTIIAIGRQVTSLHATLIIHAVGAPVGFSLVSLVYFRRFRLTTPFVTAAYFLLVIVTLDALVVAPLFEGSYAMFANPLGTWIPFALIFGATYATGSFVVKRDSSVPG